MREQINNNPVAQIVLIGVLLLAAGFFAMTTLGGGGDEEEPTTTTTASATVETAAGTASITATLTTPTGAPAVPPSVDAIPIAPRPLPRAVTAAWSANRTVVLLFVRVGGIDDRLVKATVERLGSLPRAAVFVVPADRIANYAAISQGVDVDRVPALVVVRPKQLDKGGIPTASVHYGFQSPESVVQAVVDAGYRGRTVPYHP